MNKRQKINLIKNTRHIQIEVREREIIAYTDRDKSIKFGVFDIAKIIKIAEEDHKPITITIQNPIIEQYIYRLMAIQGKWDSVKLFNLEFNVNYLPSLTLNHTP